MKKFKEKVSKPFIDFLLGRTMSKKLTTFIMATVALFHDKIDGDNWTIIAGIYIFGLTFLNFMDSIKGKASDFYTRDGGDEGLNPPPDEE